jgi:hypothetical protein
MNIGWKKFLERRIIKIVTSNDSMKKEYQKSAFRTSAAGRFFMGICTEKGCLL